MLSHVHGIIGGISRRVPAFALRPKCQHSQKLTARYVAASVLVSGESDGEKAASQAVVAIKDKLGNETPSSFTLWFAKGYGSRAKELGSVLQAELGRSGVVIGSSAEGGVIGDGAEIQSETFALSVLSLETTGVRVLPFYSESLAALPTLGRGGSWSDLSTSDVKPSILAFCTLPVAQGLSPQAWCSMLDSVVFNETSSNRNLPTIVGGLTVGHHIFVDGVEHIGGAFGVAFLPEPGSDASFDAVVCQGAVPFGPTLQITGVADAHVITEIDGKIPRQVLEPLLSGPQVPGSGHTMAGIFLDQTSSSLGDDPLASSALSGRPNCVVRPIHAWTNEGYVMVSPIMDDMPFVPGMRIQLQCMNEDLALQDLRMRAGYDVMAHGGKPPDASVMISCGARGVAFYGSEGVESGVLRQAWGYNVPSTGFFAGGEIGPVGSKTFMHGYTTSCLFMRVPSS